MYQPARGTVLLVMAMMSTFTESSIIASPLIASPIPWGVGHQVVVGPPQPDSIQQPAYSVVMAHQGVEERSYQPSVWATIQLHGRDIDTALRTAVEPLASYFRGQNQGSTKIPMTRPMVTQIIAGPCPACDNTFRVSFFLPMAMSANPPKPDDTRIYFTRLPTFQTFVRSFSGFPLMKDIARQALKLIEEVNRHKMQYSPGDSFYYVEYDNMMKLTGRKNEVWLLKK